MANKAIISTKNSSQPSLLSCIPSASIPVYQENSRLWVARCLTVFTQAQRILSDRDCSN